MEACWAHNPEVRRSKLRSAKIFSSLSILRQFFGFRKVLQHVPLAQRIARWTSNPKVLGSIPRWDETFLSNQHSARGFVSTMQETRRQDGRVV